jgi:pimeloyl-ACP methyl ester carboxylesterase
MLHAPLPTGEPLVRAPRLACEARGVEPELRCATAPDGERLAYRVHGSAGVPILTVHGLVSSIQHWPYFIRHYARTHQVVSWEYRGHGARPAPADCGSISVPQFADDADAVWRAARVAPAIVVGLSFGVQVALELWRRHRAGVRALVLMCGTAGHPLDRISSSAALRRAIVEIVRALGRAPTLASPLLALLRSRGGTWLARELAYQSGGAHRDTCPRDMLDSLFEHVGGLAPELIAATIAAYLEHDAFDVLSTIDVPTLILAGDSDQLTPVSIAERIHREIRGSELAVFPGHSHLVQVEQPAGVHAEIDRFLAAHALIG